MDLTTHARVCPAKAGFCSGAFAVLVSSGKHGEEVEAGEAAVEADVLATSRGLFCAQAAPILVSKMVRKHGLIFAFALASGMRPSEYLALKWTDIDFVKHTATVQRVLTWRKGGGWYFAEPKTAKSRRTLPIPERLFVELKRHKRVQAEAMLKLGQFYERNN